MFLSTKFKPYFLLTPALPWKPMIPSQRCVTQSLPPEALASSQKFEGSLDLARLRYPMGLTGTNVSKLVLAADEHAGQRYAYSAQLTAHALLGPAGGRQCGSCRSFPSGPPERNLPESNLRRRRHAGLPLRRRWFPFSFSFLSMDDCMFHYAWVKNSAKQCPDVRTHLFAVPAYTIGGRLPAPSPPHRDVGVDGVISGIEHELAELSSNPLVNTWCCNIPSSWFIGAHHGPFGRS
ncbi:hypothetical protein VitviT2T_030661 [Vitis vinifera]|uniref:Uncharacterized protein n=2 Tax=Vitis vinifera TaxID=29760 RepID=A0ABY9E0T1_VITVI|nr:Protein EXORDIUM-like 3 [Vitis vinifera]WKA13357.1 hypothetical protein VitviT2T_030661 [Vitis vinifera]